MLEREKELSGGGVRVGVREEDERENRSTTLVYAAGRRACMRLDL
jgi:hypothetical protein